MRSVKNTSMLFASLLLLATACSQSEIVPEVKIYKEIPFVDAPEAAFVMTASHDSGLLSSKEWSKIRPYVLCVDDKGWETIKVNWLQACLMAGPKCNVMVDSIGMTIKRLDDIANTVLGPVLLPK